MVAVPQKYFDKIPHDIIGYQENVEQVQQVLVRVFGRFCDNLWGEALARHVWHQMAGACTKEVRCEYVKRSIEAMGDSHQSLLKFF